MPFSRPTLPQLIDRTITDLQTRMTGANATLRRSNLNILARVLSGAVHGLYGFITWLAEQLIFDTATAEYLERWAGIWGITRYPATFARGTVTLSNTHADDSRWVLAGTELQRVDGVVYLIDAETEILPQTSIDIAITAASPGAAGNADAPVALTLTTPIDSVPATALSGPLIGGADAESYDSLRSKFLSRIRRPPHGGAKHDYETWALEIPGVTRAWVTSAYSSPSESMDDGEVFVRFVRDNDIGGIVPSPAHVAAVQAHLNNKRPVTARVTAIAPVPIPLDLGIALSPNTQVVRNAVTAELADLINREAAPGGTLYLSHIRAAISAAAGETNYVMTAPTADVVNNVGELTTLGTITWGAEPITAIPVPIHFDVQLIIPDQNNMDWVEYELRMMLANNALPGSTITLSQIEAAIGIVTGDFQLMSPTANIALAPNETAVFGGITWVS